MTGTAAIIGCGVIGGGWAARFLLNGWNVVVHDPDPQVEHKTAEVLALARRSLPALSDVTVANEGKLHFAASIAEAVGNADWVQESAPERLDLKRHILEEIQKVCRVDALVASSTSAFTLKDMQQGAANPGQMFIARPFDPVYLLPLVELAGSSAITGRASAILDQLGMKPLATRSETDMAIGSRLLEALWREALLLIEDGTASAGDIDDAIRLGFGLTAAQGGLFETCRMAGGEAGVKQGIGQSDAQSTTFSTHGLQRIRDDNLVSMMRALKARDWGAGALLNERDRAIRPPLPAEIGEPLETLNRIVPIDWTDYNGHMNESRYGQVFSDAGDVVMMMIGADSDYIASGLSYFTVDNHITYREETNAGDAIRVVTWILEAKGKKLGMYHEMTHGDGRLLATCKQLLIHVSLETRRSCLPGPEVSARLDALHEAQSKLPPPASMQAR